MNEPDITEMLELLREAETLIRHTQCDVDAMHCPGCSLESRISELIARVDK